MATLIYLSQNYSYYIRGDESPLRFVRVERFVDVGGGVWCLNPNGRFLSNYVTVFYLMLMVSPRVGTADQLGASCPMQTGHPRLFTSTWISGIEPESTARSTSKIWAQQSDTDGPSSVDCIILPWKAKRQYLLTLQVSRYCHFTLQISIDHTCSVINGSLTDPKIVVHLW